MACQSFILRDPLTRSCDRPVERWQHLRRGTRARARFALDSWCSASRATTIDSRCGWTSTTRSSASWRSARTLTLTS